MFLAFGMLWLELRLLEHWSGMKGAFENGDGVDIYFHDTYFVVPWLTLSVVKGVLLIINWGVCVALLEWMLRRKLDRRAKSG